MAQPVPPAHRRNQNTVILLLPPRPMQPWGNLSARTTGKLQLKYKDVWWVRHWLKREAATKGLVGMFLHNSFSTRHSGPFPCLRGSRSFSERRFIFLFYVKDLLHWTWFFNPTIPHPSCLPGTQLITHHRPVLILPRLGISPTQKQKPWPGQE